MEHYPFYKTGTPKLVVQSQPHLYHWTVKLYSYNPLNETYKHNNRWATMITIPKISPDCCGGTQCFPADNSSDALDIIMKYIVQTYENIIRVEIDTLHPHWCGLGGHAWLDLTLADGSETTIKCEFAPLFRETIKVRQQVWKVKHADVQ